MDLFISMMLCDMCIENRMDDRARSRLCNGLLNGKTHINHIENRPFKDQPSTQTYIRTYLPEMPLSLPITLILGRLEIESPIPPVSLPAGETGAAGG